MRNLLVAVFFFAALTAARPAAAQEGWKGLKGVGGYVSNTNFATSGGQLQLMTQGATFLYGVTQNLRVGGELGALVADTGGGKDNGGGTNYGFSVGPAADYDVVRRNTVSLYALSRPLNATILGGNNDVQTRWNLSFISAGLGLEA
ncbi:MAG: hypothetical protein KGL53_06165, partial [Elusimicrobia bacterium]|nr:hypothetical protein [Elusimicrobiota bacterium]